MASLGFTVAYDTSVVSYSGFSQNGNFGTFNVNTGSAGQITMASTSASAAMNGFFRFATVRFTVLNSLDTGGAPQMEWKWPAEHNVDCNDYHPRFGNGRVVVGGHSSSSYKLQNACDGTTSSYYHSNTDDQPPSSPPSYGYGVNQDRYKGDYIDFIFTFEDANTWCSGYRQSYGGSVSTNEIEIFTSNQNFGPWTSVATDNHANWHSGSNDLAYSGVTTEWAPSGPSKYLKVRTKSNHGDTSDGGRILVRYIQLKFGVGSAETTGISTGISVYFSDMANAGNNPVTAAHYSSVYDFRQAATHGGAGTSPDTVYVKVVPTNDRALYLHPDPAQSSQDHGKIFNYRSIDGQNHDNLFSATVVTDRMSSTETGTPLQYEQRDATCSSEGQHATCDVHIWGGGGGGGCWNRGRAGGAGGYTFASGVKFQPDTTYTFVVGQGGRDGNGGSRNAFGGGGSQGHSAGNGGGLSGIFVGSYDHANALLVAGGGGGGGTGGGTYMLGDGGAGGGVTGESPGSYGNCPLPTGGTQSGGGVRYGSGQDGTALQGRNSGCQDYPNSNSCYRHSGGNSGGQGGGGGGGYYGGAGGHRCHYSSYDMGGGAGGSGYVAPTLTGVTYSAGDQPREHHTSPTYSASNQAREPPQYGSRYHVGTAGRGGDVCQDGGDGYIALVCEGGSTHAFQYTGYEQQWTFGSAQQWKWPSEHNIECNDYHPRIGGGQEIVNGWGGGDGSTSYRLQNACDSSGNDEYRSENGYGVGYPNYVFHGQYNDNDDDDSSKGPDYLPVGEDDYVDFVFTFPDEDTWVSGYRQTGSSGWSWNAFPKEIEIFTGDYIFGPWTSVATSTLSKWRDNSCYAVDNNGNNCNNHANLNNPGVTTEWIPTGPSKYLKVRTYSNHGYTGYGGLIAVRFIQLKFGRGINYEESALGSANRGQCTVRIREGARSDSSVSTITASTEGACQAQTSGICAGSANFMVVSPSSVVLNVSDTTLNKIAALDTSVCGAAEHPYQKAAVSVIADGYDVTSLATGLHIDSPAVAGFVTQLWNCPQGSHWHQYAFPSKLLELKATSITGSVGAAITTWPDTSGNSNDASSSGSIVNAFSAPVLAKHTDSHGGVHKVVRFGCSNCADDSTISWGTYTPLQASAYVYSTQSAGLEAWAVLRAIDTGTASHDTQSNAFVFDFGRQPYDGYGMSYAAEYMHGYTPTHHGGKSQGASTTKSYDLAVVRMRVTFGSSDTGEMRLERNGQVVMTTTISTTALTATQIYESTTDQSSYGPFMIGAQSQSSSRSSRFFRGEIAELTLYDGLLSGNAAAQRLAQLAAEYGITIPDSVIYAHTHTPVCEPPALDGQDVQTRVRGKVAGSFTLKLYDSPHAPSVAMSVSDAVVSVAETSSNVVTDVLWNTAPASSYTYTDLETFGTGVTVSQVLRRRPAGTTRGHYGYLFQSVRWTDGTVEEVMADETTIDNQSPTVIFTAPDAVDMHTSPSDSSLWMYNSGTDRWLVTISVRRTPL